jgi:protein involved in polysaccharide export with SLBB domain
MKIVRPEVSFGHSISFGSQAGALAGEPDKPTELSVEMERILLLFMVLAVPTLATAQTQTRERRLGSSEPLASGESTAVRRRVVGPTRAANHAEKQNTTYPRDQKPSVPISDKDQQVKISDQTNSEPGWGNTPVVSRSAASEKILPEPVSANNNAAVVDRTNKPMTKLVQTTAIITEVKPAPSSIRSNNPSARTSIPLRTPTATAVYHVGIGDVLDIRLANLPTRESTLFTVLKNGVLEYPLLNGPISVAGLTTEEIANLLSTEIRVIRAARVSVTVRDYASHAVVVTGLVDSPGRKTLRREAMPLYAVLAEALPRAEATVATIVRAGKSETVALDNEQSMSMLVMSGDAIKVSGNAANGKGFVYIGGDVTSPGEKGFRDGMTLTQALISAGGVPRSGKTTVKVARRNASGFLTANDYNVQSIQDGKTQDPLLQAGDRIEVTRGL